MGDLNYRITSDIPSSTVFEYAKSDFTRLLKRDQLRVSQQAGLAFVEFTEPSISFPPTYKYITGTSIYDQRPEKKIRCPAWCDRILYYLRDKPTSDQQNPLVITDYEDVDSINVSDHKPVYQRSVLLVKKYDETRMAEIRKACEQKLKKGENNEQPVVQFSTAELAFGYVAFRSPVTHTVSLSNEGLSNIYYRFLPRDSENHVGLPFFSVSQLFGMILPGERADITVTLEVTPSTLRVCVLLAVYSSTFKRKGE